MEKLLSANDFDGANCKEHISRQLISTSNGIEPVSFIERPLKLGTEILSLQHLVGELHNVFSSDRVNVEYLMQVMNNYKSNPSDWKKYAKFDRFRYTRNLVDAGNGLFNIMILCWGEGHASAIHDHADSHCFMKMLAGELEEVRYSWPKACSEQKLRNQNDIINNNHIKCSNIEDLGELMKGTDIRDKCAESGGNNCIGTPCNNGAGDENENCCEEENEENCAENCNGMKEIGRYKLEVNDTCYINDTLGLHRVENPSHIDGAVSLHIYCPPFDSCRVFDARTGKATTANVTFWSKYGSRRNRDIQDNRPPVDN